MQESSSLNPPFVLVSSLLPILQTFLGSYSLLSGVSGVESIMAVGFIEEARSGYLCHFRLARSS